MIQRKEVGIAYVFFDCNANKGRIKYQIPAMRMFANIPPEVEISVTNLRTRGLRGYDATELRAKREGFAFSMRVMFPGRDNEAAARQAAELIKRMTRSSPVFERDEPFRGRIEYGLDVK